jgi:hypothetical protein
MLQKPLAANRDAIDLITTIGWAWKVTPGLALGGEAHVPDLLALSSQP